MPHAQPIAPPFDLKRSIAGLLGMVVLLGLGERMAEKFVPVYLVALGGGSLVIGLFSGLRNLLGALYSYPAGYLADRIGPRRSLLVFNLLAMGGFLVAAAVPHWTAVIGGSLFFLAWSAVSTPAMLGLISRLLPPDRRTMAVTLHSLTRKAPNALGPLLGGLLIGVLGVVAGVRTAFLAAALLAGVSILVQRRMLGTEGEPVAKAGTIPRHPLRLFRAMSPSLRNLLVADILIRFCEQIPEAFVVLWCMHRAAHPVTAVQFGVLTTIEQVTALLLYLPVAWMADRSSKKPFVVVTFVFFTLFPLALMYCHSFWPLAGAFVLRGLKEFGEPTRKALILDLCPSDMRATMFGYYYFLRDTIVSAAAFGGAYLWERSPQTNFVAASAVGLIGTVWFAIRGKDLGKA